MSSPTPQKLPIVEQFYSIQGEGYHTGKAAYFLRVGGCDVGCGWCDEKRTWDASQFPQLPITDLAKNIINCKAKAVVITGGEPMKWDLDELTRLITDAGVETYLETSGTNPISGKWNWICLSPKRKKDAFDIFYQRADELKCIVADPSDLLWAEICAKRIKPNCQLWLQPEWRSVRTMMPIVTEYVLNNPKWKISIQSHKYMKVP